MIVSMLLLGRGGSYFLDWEIIRLNSSSLVGAVVIDWMSMMFLSFVTFISSIVLYYSGAYIRGDNNVNRFMYLVLLFVISMGFLIIRPNLIRILLGWDGLGLVSYVLVIYYQSENRANAGILTALSNRVGDVAILLRISFMFGLGRWNFMFNYDCVSLVCLGIIVLAAITKRAQIPFSAWLPAAIAAPTPVSALVHSSTLVTAGVYLLIRFSPRLSGTNVERYLLLFASLTIFMAGLGANFEIDLKKVIALSTLSQLGVIIVILSLGWAELAFFHLLTHALFKALLFIRAGSVIHRVGDYQDIRVIGGLVNYMPLSIITINLANLALCGMPFLAGFYSKDLILEVAFNGILNEFCFWLLVLSTGLTVCYTFRLIFYRMVGNFNLKVLREVDDRRVIIVNPMVSLAIGAVVGGCFLSWLIFPSPSIICITFGMKLLALIVSVLGGIVGYILNVVSVSFSLFSLNGVSLVGFSGSIWFIPFLSRKVARMGFLIRGQKYHHLVDRGWLEYYGGRGFYRLFSFSSKKLQFIQDNNIIAHVLMLLLWLVVFILFL